MISLSILIEEKFANNPVIIREDEEIFINIGWVIISFIIAIIFVNFMNLFFMVMNLLVDSFKQARKIMLSKSHPKKSVGEVNKIISNLKMVTKNLCTLELKQGNIYLDFTEKHLS